MKREGEPNGQALVMRWPRHARSVGLARTQLRKQLASWGLLGIEDDAVLVLSELLTNAVQHARVSPGREIETRYLREGDGVRIEVHDASDEWPQMRMPDVDAVAGRGLVLIDVLAAQWGVTERAVVGKAVWAVVAPLGTGGDRHGA